MKSTVKSILLIAAAAMAFSACNEEPLETPKTSEETNGTHKVTFIASQVETKTTMDINDGVASFDWEKADVDFFHIFENDYSYRAKDAEGKIGNDGLMQITATFENGGSAPFSYFGFFAPTFYNYPQVPVEQTDNGKYDPMADILVAKPVTADASQSGKAVSFQFKRIVAINVMTLKGLTAGETVSEVKIVSDKPIAGKYDYANEKWYNSTDMQITVSANSVADENGQAVVYFVSAPVENAQLTVTATTAAGKTYSKELAKTITFAEGGVKAFGVTVEAEAEDEEPAYVKVTSTSDLTDGKYLIVCEDQNVAFDGSLETLDAVGNTVAVTISDGEITPSEAIDAVAFTFTASNGSFLSGSGKYIGNNSNSNALATSSSALSNTVSISDGDANIVSAGGSYLRYNAASNQTRFRYFKSSTYSAQKAIQLYKYNGTIETVAVTGVTLSESELTLEVGNTETLEATIAPEDADNKNVTWSSNNEDVATVENGVVTAIAAGEATITVTTVDGAFTATCDVTVNAAPVKEYSSLAELIADGEPTEAGTPVTVTLSDVVIESIFVTSQGYRNGVYLEVPETDKKIEIYSRNVPADWEAFGKLSGTLIECTWKKFNSTTWELCPEDWDDLDYTAPVKYNIVVPTGLVGGTVSADIYEAAAGATVTLTATPSTGYQFVSWSVKDASENYVTVTNNAFTMPASDVTVSATFEQSEGGQGGPKTISWSRSETTDTVSENYTLSQNLKSASGYYQDNSTSKTYYLEVKGTTPIFSSTPSSVTFTAKLGGGTTKDLSGNGIMYVVLVDNNGNEITGTKTEVTNKITATTGSDFTVSINVTGVSSAYGFKLYHEKIASYNVRYYSATLTAQ